jgi:RTX calcium-binding nonapeptide repeat (4 copies)
MVLGIKQRSDYPREMKIHLPKPLHFCPITRRTEAGQVITVVQAGELHYQSNSQGNLMAGTDQPTQEPIYQIIDGVNTLVGYREVPSNDELVTDNVLIGSAGRDAINGLTGSDLIMGGAGNDVIDGGEGADMIGGGCQKRLQHTRHAASRALNRRLLRGKSATNRHRGCIVCYRKRSRLISSIVRSRTHMCEGSRA